VHTLQNAHQPHHIFLNDTTPIHTDKNAPRTTRRPSNPHTHQIRLRKNLPIPHLLPHRARHHPHLDRHPSKTSHHGAYPHFPDGPQFQLRYCPALAKKPEASSTKKDKIDPFDNPPAELLVAEIPTSNPSHILVLNKYPIIAGHFILATKTNKQQTHVLEQDDLEATYACLKAWETHNETRRLFAFFNSGEHSGASQPHRHLQFLPVASMREGNLENEPWELLLDIILSASTNGENGEYIR
jgi:diadenosine tetraphosphate (Ap4A) HIT family hydrolase